MNESTPLETSSSSPQRTLIRKPSRPFLRKPVPSFVQEDEETVSLARSPQVSPLEPPPQGFTKGDYGSISDVRSNKTSSSDQPSHHVLSPSPSSLARHLSLVDLVAVGVGGTVGSGLFVLTGLVAHRYAGPATALSWLISGVTACVSGFCYAELAARIPLAGGSYAFTYVASGEVFAVVTAACLSVEYIAASAAVARSWGDKCLVWMASDLQLEWTQAYLLRLEENDNQIPAFFNPMALLISSALVGLLLAGVKESKAATNFFTSLKLAVVAVMVLESLYFVQPANWKPFAPFGVSGVIRGATGTFFGYLGYDQITSLAGEAQNAKSNLPRAIIGVLFFVALLYVIATLGLTGMQPYTEISTVSGFPEAFRAVDANWIAEIVSFGEIATLPIVILVSIMAQPRLFYAMAVDGLLPPIFGEIDDAGNLWKGTLIAGILLILISTFVPFENLNDMISGSVLMVLSLTDSSVVLLWHEGPPTNKRLSGQLMIAFHVLACLTGVALTHVDQHWIASPVAVVCGMAMVASCGALCYWCPRSSCFGGSRCDHYHQEALHTNNDGDFFATPGVPFLPCLAIFVNWYLIAQLELVGVLALMGFLGIVILYYFLFAAQYSVGNHLGWDSNEGKQSEMATAKADQMATGKTTELKPRDAPAVAEEKKTDL